MWELVPHAIVIALIAFMEAFSINSKLQEGEHEMEPSRELIALGGANIAAGLFQGYSVTGGFSRSAVNADAGAKSQLGIHCDSLDGAPHVDVLLHCIGGIFPKPFWVRLF